MSDVSPSEYKDNSLEDVLQRHSELFAPGIGCYIGDPVELGVIKRPKFCKTCPVPYARQSRLETALLQIEKECVITKGIDIAVRRIDCTIRIELRRMEKFVCRVFSTRFNASAQLISYPIPRNEDLHTCLRGCSIFSSIFNSLKL